MESIQKKDITVVCDDNISIAASLFKPIKSLKAAVMIGPATGIRKRFYEPFASYLCEQGFGVITFENRGIGDSLIGSIKECEVTLQDWGQLDMPAVFEALKYYFPDTTYHLVGHSAGGQLTGLMYNAHQISSMFNVASSSGRLLNMKYPYRLKALFFMNVFIPVSNFLFGYSKIHWVGMGEPLPKNVAKQWSEWCNGNGYVKTAFGKSVLDHQYNSLSFPSFWIYATDDDIAVIENVHDMIHVFTKIKWGILELKPMDYNLQEIGHMKFFSRKNSVLWKIAMDFLKKYN